MCIALPFLFALDSVKTMNDIMIMCCFLLGTWVSFACFLWTDAGMTEKRETENGKYLIFYSSAWCVCALFILLNIYFMTKIGFSIFRRVSLEKLIKQKSWRKQKWSPALTSEDTTEKKQTFYSTLIHDSGSYNNDNYLLLFLCLTPLLEYIEEESRDFKHLIKFHGERTVQLYHKRMEASEIFFVVCFLCKSFPCI